MTQIVNVPGQGDVEFPDNMSDDQIGAVIKRNLLSPMQKRMGLGQLREMRPDTNDLPYSVGGKVTDLTGSPGLGLASNVATNIVTDPLTYAGAGIGKAIEPLAKAGGFKLMWQALKPARAARDNGDAARAVQTLLDEGVNVTEGGVAKLTDKIDTLDDELTKAIASSKAKLLKTDVLQGLKDVLAQYREGTQAAKNLPAIRQVAQNLMDHPLSRGSNELTVQAAQAMKRQNYKELGDTSYGSGMLGPERDALKGVTRGLRGGIETAVPETAAINAEMSPLINARDLAQDRALLSGNKTMLGIGILNPKTLIAHMADRSELVKSLLARLLYSGVAPNAAALGAGTGAGIGGLMQQQGQQQP